MPLGNIIRFVFLGENKQAIRAMTEVGDTAAVTSKKVVAGNEEQAVSFDETAAATHRLRDSVVSLAGIAGLAGLAFGIKDVVDAGTRWRADQAQLVAALKSTGNYSAATLNQINAVTAASATHGGFSDITESGGVTRFVTQLGSVSAALKANMAVEDVARRLHIGYAQAVTIVARAQVGTVGRLQQYLGVILPVTRYTDAMTSAEKRLYPQMYRNAQLENKRATALMVNQRIMKEMGNSVAAYSHQTEGAITNAENSLQILAQFLGAKLGPAIRAVANGLSSVAAWVMDHWSAIARGIHDAFSPVVSVVKWVLHTKAALVGLGAAVGVFALITAAVYAWAAAQAVWDVVSSPMFLFLAVVALIAAGVYELVTHFKQVTSFLDGVFTTAWRAASRVVTGFFMAIKAGISDAANWVASRFDQIVTFVAGLPNRIAHAAVGLWDGLKKGLIDVVNWIIRQVDKYLIGPFNSLITVGGLLNFGQGIPKIAQIGGGAANTATVPYTPQRSTASVSPHTASAATGAGFGTIVLNHQTVIGNRVAAESVTRYAITKAAVS